MDNNSNIASFIKKNRISIIAVLAFTVAFCSIFVFAGSRSEEPVDEISVSVSSESVQSNLQGSGIYLDGYFVAAVSDSAVAESVLNTVLNERAAALALDENAEISFANSVELVSGEYPADSFLEQSALAALLGENVTAYNGEALPVKLSVSSVVTYSEDVVIEYDTKTIYTDALNDGVSKVVSDGFNGEGTETYKVSSVDGVETERVVLSLDVTTAAVDKVVRVGTRNDDKIVASLSSEGYFIKPYDGYVTSGYGIRWNKLHKGLDIIKNDCFRDPVVAAAEGVVTLAEDNGNGYGNHVVIDHGNGVVTLYAHFDTLTVEEGDIVKQGDIVGLIGSTGNSTAPHLHFEIRINGEVKDPFLFLDYVEY